MAKREKRELTTEEIKEVLALKPKDIDAKLLRDYFSASLGVEARFNTYDTFTLPAGKLFNKTAIKTTIGRYIINLFVMPEKYLKKYGYINDVLTKKAVGSIEAQITDMLLYDEMTTKEYCKYLDNVEWISMNTSYFLSPSMDFDINKPIKEVMDLKNELFEKYKKELEAGDTTTINFIEKTLVDLARKKIVEKGNESFDFFESGIGAFDNNYKKTSILGGAVRDPFTKKITAIKSNYIDGISKEEIAPLANLTTIGGYSRGVQTQQGGYETKKINNAVQSIILDEHGSDCGTTNYLKIEIQEKIKSMFIDRYIVENGKLVLLTPENINKYVGKEVLMRSPMFCHGDRICNKCAGELFYRIGIKNAGLLTSTFSGSLMNKSMKLFHDTSIRYNKVDLDEFIKKH